MQHTNICQRSESIPITSKGATPPAIVTIYKLTPPLFVPEDITPIAPDELVFNNFIEDYYKVDYILPDENCYIWILVDGVSSIYRVGTPVGFTIFHVSPTFSTGELYPLRQLDFDGNTIFDDNMSEAGSGLYYYTAPSEVNNSIIEFEGAYSFVKEYSAHVPIAAQIVELSFNYGDINLPIDISANSIVVSI